MIRGATPVYPFKDFPHSSHRMLLDWAGRGPATTLDVGAASGFLGLVLAARGHTVIGAESNPVSAAAAAPHYAAFYTADVASLPVLCEGPFDVVVAGDILEHLADPAGALERLVAQMAPGGRFLVSVPNVAFATVRLELLLGRFEYRPRGIMDATHLRFFTRSTLRRMLSGAGLTVMRLAGVPPPLPLLGLHFLHGPGRLVYEAAWAAARIWPTLFAFQFVAEAKR
jgi:2-polyprenyl-3-methyl-5-hydroxy-6-metoxy-1,4-benzoquinol methylase